MKLKQFKDGTAMFADRTPMSDLTIEVSGNGYLHIGDKTYPIKDGVAHVGELPQGDYAVSVVHKNKIYRAYEHIVVTDTGVAVVDDSHLWEITLDLKERVDVLTASVRHLEKTLEKHEERISGVSLFGY